MSEGDAARPSASPSTVPPTPTRPVALSQAVTEAVRQTMAAIPPNRRRVVTVDVGEGGIEGAVGMRIGAAQRWELGAWGGTDWGGNPSFGVRLQGSW